MDHYEMVEKLRQKANVSYEDAKAALEAADWDMLDALILLESQGKVKGAQGGKEYTTQEPEDTGWKVYTDSDFRRGMKRLWKFLCMLVRKGNANSFVISNRDKEEILSMPVTVLVILFFCIWPLSMIGLIVGLFVGGRYSFRGPDSSQRMNDAMNRAADMAQGEDERK